MARKVPLPLIDKRTPADVVRQTKEFLSAYLAQDYEWTASADGGESGRALVGVFAHYCGLVIDRINRAPTKNFLAFLDLLGNSPIPAVPAQAPVTFFLDQSATEGFNLPAGTRIQAEPANGASEPILFETERDFWLTNFELKVLGRLPKGETELIDMNIYIDKRPGREEKIGKEEKLFDSVESFYFGLYLAPDKIFSQNRPVSLYFFIDRLLYSPASSGLSPASVLRVVWEYSAGTEVIDGNHPSIIWESLLVEDGTAGLTRTGAVEFLVPENFVKVQRHRFEKKLFWIRAYLKSVEGMDGVDAVPTYKPAPHLMGVSINTIDAYQNVSIRDEVLGSGNGNAGQIFTTFKKPVLHGQRLEIRERRLAAALPGSNTGTEDWTAWQEVQDFYESKPVDRHYVVDRQAGEIRFGDGQQGMIPPPGTRNVRMALYRTSVGSAGNVAAGTLKTLVAGARHIDKVSNLVPAAGGADTETQDALLSRAPTAIRHRDRAVADEDYEDLARLASTEVARARCVPLLDLKKTPCKRITTLEDEAAGGGKVSVIIVPHTQGGKPLPSQVLMQNVESYLRQRSIATTTISVVGPLYLRVEIEVAVQLVSLSYYDRVNRELNEKFSAFLHPLSGRDGQGWPFGRKPQMSDIHRLINTVEGVDYVSALNIGFKADERPADCSDDTVACIENSQRYLIYSGQHAITITN